MSESSKRRQGFRYYVYLGPGAIEYFTTLVDAQDYQSEFGGTIGEVV